MADWAFGMLIAALLTFVVTSIGTFLIWRQVRLTREAVEDTGKATRAMERQNEITEGAQRPWVVLEIEPLRVGSKQDLLSVDVDVRFKNIGSSPAIHAHLIAETFFAEGDYTSKIDETFNEWSRTDIKQAGTWILPQEVVERRIEFLEPCQSLPFFPDYQGSGEAIFIVILASVHYYAGNGVPSGRLETTRSWLIKWQDETGFVWGAFRRSDFDLTRKSLIVETLGGHRTS